MKAVALCALLLTACTSADAENATPSPSIEIDVVQKIMPIICMSFGEFKRSIAVREKLIFFGILPTHQGHVLEIYSAQPVAFTIAIRDEKMREVCVVAHGSELVPVAPYLDSGYKGLR